LCFNPDWLLIYGSSAGSTVVRNRPGHAYTKWDIWRACKASKSTSAGMQCVGLLLVIFTSSINILVLYLLVLLAIYLQIDIYPRFIYKINTISKLDIIILLQICFINCFKLYFNLDFILYFNLCFNLCFISMFQFMFQ